MHKMKWFLHILVVTFVLLAVCEARGGGGRRGGSMGGLFGSWRKYKKPVSSSGSSRRIVSSSPVHTPITKALNEKKATGSEKFAKNSKTYNKYNTPPLPAGGSYYTNTAAMPGNAIYVAQAPPRGAEFGDFLTGYLAGRLMTMGMSPYHQVTHIYRDNPQPSNPQTNDDNSGKVIIINNGADAMTNAASSTTTASSILKSSTTETTSSSSPYALAYTSSTSATASASANTPTDTPTPANGIICIPLKVNETNASGDVIQVDRIVCYPAPPPPTPIDNEMKSKPVEIAGDIITH